MKTDNVFHDRSGGLLEAQLPFGGLTEAGQRHAAPCQQAAASQHAAACQDGKPGDRRYGQSLQHQHCRLLQRD